MTDLPKGWAEATVLDTIGGGHFSDGDWIESKDQDPGGEVRLLQLADIGEGEFRNRSKRYLTIESAKSLNCTFLEAGDILVARMPEPLGRACRVPTLAGPAVTAVDVCILRPSSQGVDPAWLMWCLNMPHVRSQVASLQSGTTRKRISRKNLGTVRLWVPPVDEQKLIVAAIEEHLSRLDAAAASLASATSRIEHFRAAAVQQAFAARDWPWTTLGEIAELKGGVTKDSKRQDDPSFVEVPYLRVANVQRGYLDLDEVTTIRVAAERAKSLQLQPGDVLFNEGGDRDKLGRGWVWEGQVPGCIHQNHVFRARLIDDEFDPRFVSTHGNTWGQRWFETHGKQTTNLASINLGTLKRFPVPSPPIAEQKEVMDQLDRLGGKVTTVASAVGVAQRRAAALRRAVLRAAFSGRLVDQDRADEPASELLDRIRETRPTNSLKTKVRS